MTTYSHLPRFPLVDLGANYLSYLEQIDVENQSRHYCGEPLLEYPTFEEFVIDCRDASFAAEPKVCAHVHDLTGFTRLHEDDGSDETDLHWLLPLTASGPDADDEESGHPGVGNEAPWVSDFGTFTFPSSTRH